MSDEDGEGRSISTTSTQAAAVVPESNSQTGEQPTMSTRVFPKVPIFIVEDHHDVLTFLYRCLDTRHLPARGNKIIHFDSHPDMCIPKHMEARCVFNKENLLNCISTENWLMPTVFAGQLERIVWIKPEWSDQIPKGKYQFHVGEYEGSIRTDSTLEYFVSEGCYQPEEHLESKKVLKLEVCSIVEYKVTDEDDLKDGYILDVDLDYFSTRNPFLKIYEEVGLYDRLKEIFVSPDQTDSGAEDDLEKRQRIAKNREEKLEFLQSVFIYLAEGKNLKHFFVDYQQDISEEYSALLEKVSSLAAVLKKEYTDEEIDWSMIYIAGCTCDITNLPHHESTQEEIHTMIAQFESFLTKLPAAPTVITMSRSSEDDYTPAEQVEMIQELVLAALKKCLRVELDEPTMYYIDQEFRF